jgi:uncharacterized protein YbjQ (UPF0145 family)
MIVTTTPSVEGRKITEYLGLVTGEVIMGANVLRDFSAALSDFFGGRAGAYEDKLSEGRHTAIDEMIERAAAMGADAIIGVDLDYEVVGQSMLMISVTGTAVKLG